MLKKITWGHGVVIALGLFILFILSLIFLFTRGWQNAEMVSDNYYQEELVYQNVIDAKNNADKLLVKPTFSQSPAGITITFPKEITLDENKVLFHLFRTNDGNLDIEKEISLGEDGKILIPKQVLVEGSYTLIINWDSNKTPYQIDYDVLWK